MSPIEYVPNGLGDLLDLARKNVLTREGEMYCLQCTGTNGDLSGVYGGLINEGLLGELNLIAKEHNLDHTVTVVDRDNCNFGM